MSTLGRYLADLAESREYVSMEAPKNISNSYDLEYESYDNLMITCESYHS